MQTLDDTLFVVTDIETTGLSPERNRVTEIGCVLVRGGVVVDEKHTLVNPEQFIPNYIQQLTGITNAMAMTAPKSKVVFPFVRDWFPAGAAFVAHNATFDFNFMQWSFRRHDVPELTHPALCTLRLARRLLPGRKSWNLDSVAGYFGIKNRSRHSALGDAHVTAKVLIKLLEMLESDHECELLDDVVSFQNRTIRGSKNTPASFTALVPTLAQMPQAPGVYFMHGRGGDVLYVGKAKNLRDRAGSYFRPGTVHTEKNRELVKKVRNVTFTETDTEMSALLLESRLIKEMQPPYNRMLRRYRKYAFLRLDAADAFPRLDTAMQIEPDGAEYYGPFSNRDHVELLIETINHLFRIRECTEPLRPSLSVVPCLYHQMKRCNAPCALLESPAEYAREVDRVREFLSGSGDGVMDVLLQQMNEYAEALMFEEAARLRDRMKDYQRVFARTIPIAATVHSRNLVVILPSSRPYLLDAMMIRHGRLIRQFQIGRRLPEKTLAAELRRVYFRDNESQPHYRREEIDEIRIVAGYLHQHREEGAFVHINGSDPAEMIVAQIGKAVMQVRGER